MKMEKMGGYLSLSRLCGGEITKEDVIVIGIVHVLQGSWQPILQLNRYGDATTLGHILITVVGLLTTYASLWVSKIICHELTYCMMLMSYVDALEICPPSRQAKLERR
jgi:hypothetical protein